MASTLFQAPQYDPGRERRRRQIIAAIAVLVVLLGMLAYLFRNWPEERIVDRFFTFLEKKDFEAAYAIWVSDKNWKQHPQQHSRYPFNEFYLDWGPGGEFGAIRSHKIEASGSPPRGGSGVIVVVTINDRKEPARLWVEKSDKSLTFSPY
ncbi:MAG TPA: hypothetical protein VF938_12710 [Candidatus Angelobacter sp.]